MTLRDQLRDLLPELLPSDPGEAIKGTELIRLAKFSLRDDYSDATLRYHFSIMSCDPSAPIAKVSQGQGYYLRPGAAKDGAHNLIAFRQPSLAEPVGLSPAEIDRDLLHAGKFRAIADRFLQTSQRHAFFFGRTLNHAPAPGTLWRFPDAAVVDWPSAEATEQGMRLAQVKVARRRALGAPVYQITALKLRLRISHDTAREEFFQCLSHSEWAHGADFWIATAVDDASLADMIAQLGQRHGVGVLSLGFDPNGLDDLPDPAAIAAMSAVEVEAMLGRGRPRRLSHPTPRPAINWSLIDSGEFDSPEMEALFSYIENCLESGIPVPP